MEFEAVIGLEVHIQLKTRTKIFTRVPYGYGQEPNTLTNPVVMALPGALPVLNQEAILQMVRMGLSFDCRIADVCSWDRKSYFYPDSPKNYQLTQNAQPICIGGKVEIELPGSSRNVMGEHKYIGIHHIHLEEDVGKLTHFSGDSLVDYNRAGSALAELVTLPAIHSAEEAVAFLNSVRMTLVAAGVSDCDMEKGQMRCDANVSVRPKGSDKLGTRTEMKNLNSISGVRDAIQYEIKRQINVINGGGTVNQQTRRWNAESGVTTAMRDKEDAHDYRYFPDPDLMPVRLPREEVEKIRIGMPERSYERQRRYMEQLNLPYTVTSVLCPDRKLSEFFEEAYQLCGNAQATANIIINDLLRELFGASETGSLPLEESRVRPGHVASLVKLIDQGVLSKQMAKDVFSEMFTSGSMPEKIVEEKGLAQTSDSGELEKIIREAIDSDPAAVEQYRSGNVKAINSIKGKIMKATKGKANPAIVDQIMTRLLG